MPFVVDSSMALAWVMPDEAGIARGKLELLLSDEGVAPAIWPLETANGVLVAKKRGRLEEADGARALTRLADLPIGVEPLDRSLAWTRLFELARSAALTVYDASYVELAMRVGLPLMTLDQAMAAAAKRLGVEVLGAD